MRFGDGKRVMLGSLRSFPRCGEPRRVACPMSIGGVSGQNYIAVCRSPSRSMRPNACFTKMSDMRINVSAASRSLFDVCVCGENYHVVGAGKSNAGRVACRENGLITACGNEFSGPGSRGRRNLLLLEGCGTLTTYREGEPGFVGCYESGNCSCLVTEGDRLPFSGSLSTAKAEGSRCNVCSNGSNGLLREVGRTLCRCVSDRVSAMRGVATSKDIKSIIGAMENCSLMGSC